MTDNAMRFAAIRGIQAGRTFYVVMVPLKTVGKLFRFDDPELPADLKAQRVLNHSRIPAITRYVDEAFPGPKLQPADPKRRARMVQFVSVIDSYAYPNLIGKVVWQRGVVPLLGGVADEKVVSDALPMVERGVTALETLVDGAGPFLCGPEISLADLHLAPVIDYFSGTPEGKTLLSKAPRLGRWWQLISTRPSVVKTQPKLG